MASTRMNILHEKNVIETKVVKGKLINFENFWLQKEPKKCRCCLSVSLWVSGSVCPNYAPKGFHIVPESS